MQLTPAWCADWARQAILHDLNKSTAQGRALADERAAIGAAYPEQPRSLALQAIINGPWRTPKGTGPGGCREGAEVGKQHIPLLFGHSTVNQRFAAGQATRVNAFAKSVKECWAVLEADQTANVEAIVVALRGRPAFAQSVLMMGKEEAEAMQPYIGLMVSFFRAVDERIPAAATGTQRARTLEGVLREVDKFEVWRRRNAVPWDTEGGSLDKVRWDFLVSSSLSEVQRLHDRGESEQIARLLRGLGDAWIIERGSTLGNIKRDRWLGAAADEARKRRRADGDAGGSTGGGGPGGGGGGAGFGSGGRSYGNGRYRRDREGGGGSGRGADQAGAADNAAQA